MPKIEIVLEANTAWLQHGALRQRIYCEGAPDHEELFEVDASPNVEAAQHAHTENEIIYILAGSMRFGSRECPAGTTIYIPKKTLYRFTTGPEGCRFLNFRARASQTLYRDDLRSERGGGTS